MKKKNQIQNETATAEILEHSKSSKHRDQLKQFSKDASLLVQSGKYSSINQALIKEFYQRFTNQPFKTMEEWNSLGFKIKKNEEAYMLWGKRIDVPATESKEAYSYFPLKYVFNNDQVESFSKEDPA